MGDSAHADADAALGAFDDFPRWMWRIVDFAAFVEALKEHNAVRPSASAGPVGLYGVDLYAPELSAAAVIAHLETTDATSAVDARDRYRCAFEWDGTNRAGTRSCAAEAREQLGELTAISATAGQPFARCGIRRHAERAPSCSMRSGTRSRTRSGTCATAT